MSGGANVAGDPGDLYRVSPDAPELDDVTMLYYLDGIQQVLADARESNCQAATERRADGQSDIARLGAQGEEGAEEQVAMEKKSEKGFSWATDLHVQNFLECVRTRKTPSAPMKLAFQAALVVQMANLSLKNERRMRWNNAANRVES